MITQFVIRLSGPEPRNPIYLQSPAATPQLMDAPQAGNWPNVARFSDETSARAALDLCSTHGLIGAIHPIEKGDDTEYLLEEICSNRPKPTVEVLRSRGPTHFIVALANSFPCLRDKIQSCGITPRTWDVDFWMRAQRPWSHGEKAAAVFVAVVWNCSGARSKKWRFDAIDALGVWDSGNRNAFIAWAKSPVWP